MFIISKEFHFESAHKLRGLPPDHPCSRLHGHGYIAIFTFKRTTVDEIGFVVDYRSMDNIKNWIDGEIDHRCLNDIFDFNPTAELIAKHFYEVFIETFPDLASVTIKETQKTAATYEPYLIKHRGAVFTR